MMLAQTFGTQLELPATTRWNPYPRVSGSQTAVLVAPLAVLTIDDLERLEQLTEKHALGEILTGYALDGASSQRSFSAFLTHHPLFSRGRRWNPYLREVALTAADDLDVLFRGMSNDPDVAI